VTRQTINSIEKGRFHPNRRWHSKLGSNLLALSARGGAFGKQIAEVFIYEDI